MLTEGRLNAPPMPSLVDNIHAVELTAQLEGLQEYVLIDLAHVLMLGRRGVLPAAEAALMLRSLLRLAGPMPEVELATDVTQGSITLQIEAYLLRECGEPGGNIQTARSRIDQNAEAYRLVARRHLLDALDALLGYENTLLEFARRHADVIAPGYTHLQHSQPTTLGHFFNAHYWVAARAFDRLFEVLRRTDLSSLGGAALVGTSWDIDRDMTAVLLGHPGVILNARDAGVPALDVAVDVAGALALMLSGLGRLAGDLYYWVSSEVGLARLDAGLCGTSSMMPQKRNPYALERVRSLAGESIGWAVSELGILRMGSSTDADLVFSGNRLPGFARAATGAVRLLTDCVDTLTVDEQAMAASANAHWSTASALADELVRATRCSFRTAHELVGRVVRLAEEDPGLAAAGPLELLAAAVKDAGLTLDVSGVDVTVLDARHFLATRTSPGGAAPQRYAELAEAARRDHEEHRDRLQAVLDRVDTARTRLLAEARQYVTDHGTAV